MYEWEIIYNLQKMYKFNVTFLIFFLFLQYLLSNIEIV